MSGRLFSSARPSGPSYLDGELPLGEVGLALLGLLENPRRVLRRQATADGAGLLGPEVKGQVLLVLVEEAELGPLLRVDDGENAGDRLADVVAIREENTCQPMLPDLPPNFPSFVCGSRIVRTRIDVHLGELGARRDDLLDAELAQLRLELTQLLGELVLVLRP
jgi:hypothetical protein